jgi:glycosyltransferase involved in cell wall biosynthesis
MIKINDIDVFILSYNRSNYLKMMIESLLAQTVGEFEITILDNGSTDNTKEVINSFNNENINFIGSEQNNGALWNFKRAQNLSTKKYTIMFHDDDLIHPKFLEYVIKALNEFDNVSIVCSGMEATTMPNMQNFKNYKFNPVIFKSISAFASLVYLGFPLNYATVVYKTSYLKCINMKKLNDIYGKIADRPTIYEVAKNGNILLFRGQYIQYRIHKNQDSGDSKTGPFPDQTINLHKYYKEIIYNEDLLIPKFYFLINFYKYLIDEYKRFYKPKLSQKEYIQKTIKELKLLKKEVIFSKMCGYLRINIFFKLYRFLKRNLGEYS